MSDPLVAALLILMGYLAGSLPTGVIVARVSGGTDPRTVGSGRTGGTNVLRAMGPGRAIVVAAIDLSKGAAAILIARVLDAPVEVQALVGLAAILGSWKSVFLRFHGGRGVATAVGGILVISPVLFVVAAPAFLIVIGITRYVSLGSLLGTAFGAAAAVVFVVTGRLEAGWLLYIVPGLAIVWMAHLDNIRRLLDGTERRFDPGDRKPTPPPDHEGGDPQD